jgi:hypothetical protein
VLVASPFGHPLCRLRAPEVRVAPGWRDDADTAATPDVRAADGRESIARSRGQCGKMAYGSERGPVALPVFKIGRSPRLRGGWVRLPGASASLRVLHSKAGSPRLVAGCSQRPASGGGRFGYASHSATRRV